MNKLSLYPYFIIARKGTNHKTSDSLYFVDGYEVAADAEAALVELLASDDCYASPDEFVVLTGAHLA